MEVFREVGVPEEVIEQLHAAETGKLKLLFQQPKDFSDKQRYLLAKETLALHEKEQRIEKAKKEGMFFDLPHEVIKFDEYSHAVRVYRTGEYRYEVDEHCEADELALFFASVSESFAKQFKEDTGRSVWN